MTIAGDPVDREPVAERAHSARRAPFSRQPVSSTFKVARALRSPHEVGVGPLECVPGPLQDAIDAAGADPGAEQLLAQLDGVPARNPVSDRESRDGGLQPRTERAGGGAAGSSPVRSTPHSGQRARKHWCSVTLTASRRQLLNLMARRRTHREVMSVEVV